MYGTSYRAGSGLHTVSDPTKPGWVLAWLNRLTTGTFINYGCGSGELLVAAKQRGWDVLGVELRKDVALRKIQPREPGFRSSPWTRHSTRVGLQTSSAWATFLSTFTDLDREMTRILSLIERGGLLLAQGPLEANGNLFNWTVRLARSLGVRRATGMPLYHVILATVEGQWALFHRSGLDAIEESVIEVSWPSLARLSSKDLLDARTAGALCVAPRFACAVATETQPLGKLPPLTRGASKRAERMAGHTFDAGLSVSGLLSYRAPVGRRVGEANVRETHF